jgi:MFS family permease
MSSWYFLPLYFQAVRDASPTRSGLLILPTVVVQAFVGVVAGYYMNATGQRLPLIYVGMLLTTLGFSLFITFATNTQLARIVAIEVTAGVGVGLTFQAPLLMLHARSRPEHLATGTALFGFVRSISTTVSIVIGGVVFQNGMSRRVRALTSQPSSDMFSKFSGALAVANVPLITNLPSTEEAVIQAIYAKSLRDMWILYASVAALGFLVSFGIRRATIAEEQIRDKPPPPVQQQIPSSPTEVRLETLRQA